MAGNKGITGTLTRLGKAGYAAKGTQDIYDNPRMNMEVEAARVIETITSVTIEKEEVDSMGNVNMCKAIQEMMQDSRDEGRLAGLTEGRLQLLTTLIQSGKVTVKEAATLMDMTQEEFLAKSKTIS